MKAKTKESFTQFEKTCPDHTATEDRHCYCDRIDDMCNKTNCWKFKKEVEDE